MASRYRYLFGPVPSRRLGRSLGVDLTPFKTCSHDCVFCQLGRTTHKTIKRKEYVPTEEVLAELDHWLSTDGQADYITLSGSGEPTLHSDFGRILEFIRTSTKIPSVMLTNGSMLFLPEVRLAASAANVVKVSLSAWNQPSFEWVNRPPAGLRFDQLLEGQKAFRSQFTGQLWVEVFLILGMNSMPEDVQKIAALTKEIGPDRIQLNTAVRPTAEKFAAPFPHRRMSELTHLFQPQAEMIAHFNPASHAQVKVDRHRILEMLQRRPCTANQIADGFGMHINEVLKYLGLLTREDHIHSAIKQDGVYYSCRSILGCK
jgi:wyosine [tRNA(Phe)-imidazoG37] synthetase (radical SAM superfamily)